MATKQKPWRQVAKEWLETEKTRLQSELVDLEVEIQGETDRDRTYLERPGLYRGIVIGYLAAHAALLFIGFLLITSEFEVFDGFALNIGVLIWGLQGLHLFASLRRVEVEDLAGIDLFGQPLILPKSGLYVIPLFLLVLSRASRNYRDVRYPGPADKIFRVSSEKMKERSGGDVPDEGYVRPILVTTGEPKLSPADLKMIENDNWNPLDKQQNVEIAYFVRYRPNEKNGGIFRLIRNVGGIHGKTPEETKKIIEGLLQEQSERDMKAIISQQTYATVVENWDLVNEVFTLRLQTSVLRLGIQIDPRGGGLDDANPSRETNLAQAEARRAEFERQRIITAADAEMEKRIREGRGAAEAERLLLEGKAAGYKKIREEAGVSGQVAIASETIATFDKARSTIFGAQGIKEVIATIPGAATMFEGDGTPTQPPSKPETPPPAANS